MAIPEPFASDFRIAKNHEIRSWSLGQITKPRVPISDPLENQVGMLNDQRIFGPTVDDRCACGEYDGAKFSGMICDCCGVKATTVHERRKRFGHIELSAEPIAHPFDSCWKMECIPVIPADY